MIRRVTGSCKPNTKKKVKSCDDMNYSIRGGEDIYAYDVIPGLDIDSVKESAVNFLNEVVEEYKKKDEADRLPTNDEEFATSALANYINALEKNGTSVPDYAKEELSKIFKETAQSIVGSVEVFASCNWEDLNSTEQMAADEALSELDATGADNISDIVWAAVNKYNEANGFDEYESEDFYGEEADYNKVLRYVDQARKEDVESATDPYNYDVVDWLYEHEQAADDCEYHFGVSDLNELSTEDILGWIYDHGQLWTDFVSRFPEEARWFVEEIIGNPWEDEDIDAACDINPDDLDYRFDDADVGEFDNIDILESENTGDYNRNLEILTQMIMDKLNYEGYIPDQDYAQGGAELILMGDEPITQATVDQWFEDTKMNYPEDLENLKGPAYDGVESCDAVMAADAVEDADYFDALTVAVEDAVDARDYRAICRVEGDSLLIEIYGLNDDEYETVLHTYSVDLADIEPNMDDIPDDADAIAEDAVYECEVFGEGDQGFVEIDSKEVVDSDGQITDYTMYLNENDGTYIFMFGDKDAYGPDPDYADWECETEQEAWEWFDSYEGPGEEE